METFIAFVVCCIIGIFFSKDNSGRQDGTGKGRRSGRR